MRCDTHTPYMQGEARVIFVPRCIKTSTLTCLPYKYSVCVHNQQVVM